eukprot:jgi/Chlat1/5909/Chrsp4S06402
MATGMPRKERSTKARKTLPSPSQPNIINTGSSHAAAQALNAQAQLAQLAQLAQMPQLVMPMPARVPSPELASVGAFHPKQALSSQDQAVQHFLARISAANTGAVAGPQEHVGPLQNVNVATWGFEHGAAAANTPTHTPTQASAWIHPERDTAHVPFATQGDVFASVPAPNVSNIDRPFKTYTSSLPSSPLPQPAAFEVRLDEHNRRALSANNTTTNNNDVATPASTPSTPPSAKTTLEEMLMAYSKSMSGRETTTAADPAQAAGAAQRQEAGVGLAAEDTIGDVSKAQLDGAVELRCVEAMER